MNNQLKIHLLYSLIICFGIVSWYRMEYARKVEDQRMLRLLNYANRGAEHLLHERYFNLKRLFTDYPNPTDENFSRALDTVFSVIDRQYSGGEYQSGLNQVLQRYFTNDHELLSQFDTLTQLLSATDIPRDTPVIEHIFIKNIMKHVALLRLMQRISACGDLRYDPFYINLLDQPSLCSNVGDTTILKIGLLPTLEMAKSQYAKVNYFVDNQLIKGYGFAIDYPFVARKVGKQPIHIRAEATNVLTGEVLHLFRTYQWQVY
jgi:hypothetical protein